MIRPKSIRIGPHDFKVQYLKEIAEGNYIGRFSVPQLKIELAEQQNTRMGETFLHEIIHGLHSIWCDLNLGEETIEIKEEELTAMEGMGMAQVFRDNPVAIRYILACLRSKK